MTDGSSAAMVEVLTPIWERVLRRSPIGANDDFFDLGGDAGRAAELFVEIARASGRRLRPTTICRASTIATLTDLLEHALPSPNTPLTLLKNGQEEPPVFLTHGIGGSIIDFVPLARRIQTRRPIIGLQAPGNDDTEDPFDRVEDIARYYLEAINQIQPNGPYLLIGYSLGGLVMLDIAQRLSASDNVTSLVMLDSYPHFRHLSPGLRARVFVQRVRGALAGFIWDKKHKSEPPIGQRSDLSTSRAVEGANLALNRYQPRFYGGGIKFVKAQSVTCFPSDPTVVWGKLATKIEVESVAGDHVGMVTTHVDSLAAVLSRYVNGESK